MTNVMPFDPVQSPKARSLANLARGRGGKRWLGRLPIPERAHPLVRRFYALINTEQATLTGLADRSGVPRQTISDWRYRRSPTVTGLEAALNALGYELRIVKRYEPREKNARTQ